MMRTELDSLIHIVEEKKRMASDLKNIAAKIDDLPKGLLKKILTENIKEIFRKYGVDI